MRYFFTYCRVFDWFFPGRKWRVNTKEKIIYLTFDDGPVPGMTLDVAELLLKYEAKATFFCVGENISNNRCIFQFLINAGHRRGNHSYNHLDGVKTSTLDYVSNVYKCRQEINEDGSKQLFRPAYGRLTRKQERLLTDDFEIVMWSVLAGDFDFELSKEECLNKLVKNTKRGSIVVMHDNLKFYDKVMWVLPRYLECFTKKGYRFECL